MSIALCQPQECIHQPGVPPTADPLGSPSTPGHQGRLSCPTAEAVPPPARAQAQGTQTQTSPFTNSITNPPGCPSAQRCFIQERSLDHELFSFDAFQAILPCQSPPPVVYLFAAPHHKHLYQPANLKFNCFLHEVKPSVHNALSFPWSHFPCRVCGVGSVGRRRPH